MKLGLLVLSLSLAAAPSSAATTDTRSYFASMKSDRVYMREGPSANTRVKWVYRRKGLPVEVVASYDVWRRVRDMDGEVGWVHTALLSRDRTAVVTGKGDADVHGREGANSEVVAEAQPGAIGRLVGCGERACQVKFDAAEGWIERTRLWGIGDGEKF